VAQDAKLFGALVRCLSTSAGGIVPEHEERSGGRKRSMSFNTSDTTSTKLLKLNHSPIPAVRKVMNVGEHNPAQVQKNKPTFSVAVLAATVLYATFQHLDHWPAPLVKAYADDIFGPHLWVDDARCNLLVQNLALVHAEEEDSAGPTTPKAMIDAARVAEAYRNFVWPDENHSLAHTHRDVSPNNSIRRGSMSSTGSSVVMPPTTSTSSNGNGLETYSGDEEEGDGSSSSSGEEDELLVVTTESNTSKEVKKSKAKKSGGAKEHKTAVIHPTLYPVKQVNLNLLRVRQRFFGANVEFARYLISSSLHERLDLKSKQNSGLLQSLPTFTSIPKVRSLIASNLTKWLQSPALAGLARTLFSATVNNMKNADPPLPDDLSAIDSILAMRLKANQLNAHIENVTAIARRIPTASVARYIYSKLLKEELEVISGRSGSSELNNLKMIGAVHRAISSQVSYDAIASTLLMTFVEPLENGNATEDAGRRKRDRLITKLRRVLRSIASEFAPSFNGCQLIDSLFSLDVSSGTWSPRDEEDKARLMFQCITLSVAPYVKEKGDKDLSPGDVSELRQSLMSAKKMLLTWCCTDYGPRCSRRLRKRTGGRKGYDVAGAGVPDFRSALGSSTEEKIPSWLNTMRCLLFVEDANSDLMQHFVAPDGITGEDEPDWESEAARIRLCCDFGRDINDELFWIIMKSTTPAGGGLEPEMAIQLLENLLECCGKNRKGTLRVKDPMLVWELYNLVQYTPSERENGDTHSPIGKDASLSDGSSNGKSVSKEIPR
jgi:integrator complex subunit 1